MDRALDCCESDGTGWAGVSNLLSPSASGSAAGVVSSAGGGGNASVAGSGVDEISGVAAGVSSFLDAEPLAFLALAFFIAST